MFEALKTFIADLTGAPACDDRFGDDDYRLAAAALLVRVAAADGAMSSERRARLHDAIRDRFGLDGPSAARLIAQAIEADRRAVDLYRFTSRIARSLDDQGRRRFVEMLWDVIHTGERIGDFEQNFVWRVADLLCVSARERIELRRCVAARAGFGPAASEMQALST
jgi:uncharacterized tellurite resistance protein B-like protein